MSLSEKLNRILLSKTDLSESELEYLSERQGWQIGVSRRNGKNSTLTI